MFQAIARALAAAVAAFGEGFDWTVNLALAPVRAIFGGGGSSRVAPEFDPQVTALDMLDDLKAKATEEVHQLDRDGISTVVQYLKASALNRPTIDLTGLRRDVRLTLATMSNEELAALDAGGIGAARRFVEGKDHGIHGVPTVKPASEIKAFPTADERLKEAVRLRIRQSTESKPFAMPRFRMHS
jgi:hypothetical protein